MAVPYLGQVRLWWCDSCNVPLLEDMPCGICSSKPRKVDISPPGESRPAFAFDLSLLRDAAAPLGDLSLSGMVLLNKMGALDRSDEVVVDGHVIGSLFFQGNSFHFSPRPIAFFFFSSFKKKVQVHPDILGFLAHGDLLVPGIVSSDPFSKGDEVIIFSGDTPVASGVARIDSSELPALKKGIAVRIRRFAPSVHSPKPPSSIELAIKANKAALSRKEKQALGLIKSLQAKNLSVSYSGGKDSQVVLSLARKALGNVPVIFIDTGVEFPETIEFVRSSCPSCLSASSGSFFKALDFFGPPARDFRWCCKTCKIAPLNSLLSEHFPDGAASLDGERRYESFNRSKRGFSSSNPWAPSQRSFHPIGQWNSLDVWFYIFASGEPFNPLYALGHDRIGCWLCPASTLSDFYLLERQHPALYQRWVSFLEQYSTSMGFPSSFISQGLWRVKSDYPPTSKPSSPSSFHIVQGVSPCKSGGFSLEASFSTPLDLERISNSLRILGEVSFSKDLGFLRVAFGGVSAVLHSSGTLRITGEGALDKAAFLIRDVVVKEMNCLGCGLCASKCRNISIKNNLAVISPSCTHCRDCLQSCPLLRYSPNL